MVMLGRWLRRGVALLAQAVLRWASKPTADDERVPPPVDGQPPEEWVALVRDRAPQLLDLPDSGDAATRLRIRRLRDRWRRPTLVRRSRRAGGTAVGQPLRLEPEPAPVAVELTELAELGAQHLATAPRSRPPRSAVRISVRRPRVDKIIPIDDERSVDAAPDSRARLDRASVGEQPHVPDALSTSATTGRIGCVDQRHPIDADGTSFADKGMSPSTRSGTLRVPDPVTVELPDTALDVRGEPRRKTPTIEDSGLRPTGRSARSSGRIAQSLEALAVRYRVSAWIHRRVVRHVDAPSNPDLTVKRPRPPAHAAAVAPRRSSGTPRPPSAHTPPVDRPERASVGHGQITAPTTVNESRPTQTRSDGKLPPERVKRSSQPRAAAREWATLPGQIASVSPRTSFEDRRRHEHEAI